MLDFLLMPFTKTFFIKKTSVTISESPEITQYQITTTMNFLGFILTRVGGTRDENKGFWIG
jgi:hypothetical protein